MTERDKTDPTERTSYLAGAADPAPRERTERLLTDQPEGESQAPTGPPSAGPAGAGPATATTVPPGEGAPPPAPAAAAPERVGPYRLVRVLGEGGMGVVYLAEQEKPVRRKVALKVVKPGLGSAAIVTRFEAERQALALMDHPNIARVIDGGATAEGRPYFVMELVEGVPLTRYCDDNRLTTRERLGVFVPVCRALQHAHQKGIIHRDVKPTNVLVAVKEGAAVPKVIDFGVAKAVDQRLTDDTLCTVFGTVVGTLEYMAPEQAESSPLGVDTRADVYSLGVLLYELLTGATPLGVTRLRQPQMAEMLRIIREEEPARPSDRLGASERLPALAAQRRTDPARLRLLLRRELDWIALKALEKDRTRRYATAEALARDVERYLADEPVEACPPSAAYRLGKFARKNRRLLAVAGAFAAVLVASAAVSGWLAVRASRAEAEARALSDFLRNDLLAQASAEGQAKAGARPERDVTVRTLLDRAAERVTGKFDGKPLAEAAVRQTIGNTYYRLGAYAQAEKQLEAARATHARLLGDEHPDTLASTNNLALLYEARGRYDQAEPLLARVLQAQERRLGPDHPDTLTTVNNLGLLYRARGRPDRAEELLSRALKTRSRTLGDDHPDTLASMNNLALLYESQGKQAEAEALFTRALEGRRRVLGDDHPNTLTSMHNLGQLYRARGRTAAAAPLLAAALEGRRRALRDDHPDTLASVRAVGLLCAEAGDYARSEPLLEEALAAWRHGGGGDSSAAAAVLSALGYDRLQQHKYAEAESPLREGLALYERHQRDGWPRYDAESRLGESLLGQKQYVDAEPLLLAGFEGLKRSQAQLPAAARGRLPESAGRLAQLYEALDRKDEAARWRKVQEAESASAKGK